MKSIKVQHSLILLNLILLRGIDTCRNYAILLLHQIEVAFRDRVRMEWGELVRGKLAIRSDSHGLLLLGFGCREVLEPCGGRAFKYLQSLFELRHLHIVHLVLFAHKVELIHNDVDHHLAKLCDIWSISLVGCHAFFDCLNQHWAVSLITDSFVLAIYNLFSDGERIVPTEWLRKCHNLIDYAPK